MRTFKLLSLALMVLVAGATTKIGAAEPDKYLPNDSDTVITINLKKVLDAAMVKAVLPDKVLEGDEGFQKALKDIGFDPTKDLDAIVVALPSSLDFDKMVVLFKGRFDLAKFEAKADDVAKTEKEHLKVHKEGDYKIYETEAKAAGQSSTLFVGLVDKDTLVAARTKQPVVDALDKKAGKQKSEASPALGKLLAVADPKKSITITAVPGGSKQPENAKLKNVTGGITIGEDIVFDLVIATKDGDAAKDLKGQINAYMMQTKLLCAGLAVQNKEFAMLSGFVDLLKTVKIANDKDKVTIKARITQDLIESAFTAEPEKEEEPAKPSN